jgi:Winged helix-turn-helix DNA-binding
MRGSKSMIGDGELLRLRTDGLSYKAIAALAGISRQAVHARLQKLQERKTVDAAPVLATGPVVADAALVRTYRGLMSTRAWNALVSWFDDKELTVGDVRALGVKLLHAHNLGPTSYKEICGLFGMTCEESPRDTVKAYAQASKLERRREPHENDGRAAEMRRRYADWGSSDE